MLTPSSREASTVCPHPISPREAIQRGAAALDATLDDEGLPPPLDPNDDGTATYQNDHLETAVPISDTLPDPLPTDP